MMIRLVDDSTYTIGHRQEGLIIHVILNQRADLDA